jgi:NAD(P)-dependent dehydrogenase (short-subunit alcohol dehydrogenase family)
MARAPRFRHSFYETAKRALGGLTESLALELGRYGIRLDVLTPGPSFPGRTYEEIWRGNNRIGTPEEVADAILLLVLDEARLITDLTCLHPEVSQSRKRLSWIGLRTRFEKSTA